MTEEIKEQSFHEKVVSIIMILQAPKDVENSFAGFDYRTAEGILKAVKTACLYLGYNDIYTPTTEEIVNLEGRFYKKVTAKITDGKESYQSEAYAREPESKPKMDESQVSGSAGTYAKKYALQSLLMISDEVDPDSLDNTKANIKPQPTSKIKQQALMKEMDDLAELINVKQGTEITADDMYKTATDKKFLQFVPLEKLNEEQFMTLHRYAEELKKAYAKK